jgi:hypothetical protein
MHVSAGARIALFCLIGLLLITLGFLIACAWLLRRRGAGAGGQRRSSALLGDELREAALATHDASSDLSGVLGCPTCRRRYESPLKYCPRDARPLVPASELDRVKSGGVCPGCRRAFDPAVRFCPHDAAELVPLSIYQATHAGEAADEEPEPGSGDCAGKICPECRSRHELAAMFCGVDGSELVAIN